MLRILWAIAVFLLIFAPQGAHAFGLKTHLWIGQRIIEDLKRDCKIEVVGKREAVAADLCRSILDNQQSFLAGVIGPDGFPDLITGQITAHPGVPSDWQTSDWLNHLFADAPRGERLAFAAGYLVHAGSDTFGHSYVNAYAGDIFVLTDERAVELRHFLLEKYIDARLPGGVPDATALKVPAEFVRDRMIYNDDAARVSGKAGALHISVMRGVRRSVGELKESLDDIEAEAGRVLANVLVEGSALQIKLANGELALTAAEVGLNGAEASLKAQQQAVDLAKTTLDGAIDTVQKNDLLIAQSEAEARAARAAIDAAESAATDAASRLNQLESAVADFERKLTNIPATVAKEVCSQVTERACRWLGPLRRFCEDVTKTVCRTVNIVNDAYSKVQDQITDARKRLSDAKYTIAQRAVIAAAQGAREVSALQAKVRAEAAGVALNAARAGIQAAYDLEKAKLDAQLTATQTSRQKVVELRAEIKKFRERIIDLESIKTEIARLVAHSNLLSLYARNWEKGLDVSGAKFAEAGLEVAKGIVTMDGNTIGVYKRWLTCYGSAFTPVPYQLGQFGCQADDFYKKVDGQVRSFVLQNLPEPFRGLYRRYGDIRQLVEKRIQEQSKKAAIELAKLAAPDTTTAEFIAVLADPAGATAGKLRDAYARVGDANGKALLTFPDVTKQIDLDLALANGKVVPEQFNALAYALRLSKLALLDQAGMRRLVWQLGGDPNRIGSDDRSQGRWSILSQSLRSIDGNQQWQPFGIPYARSDNQSQPADPEKRRYGWGPADSKGGMSLFVDPELRRTVFRALFPSSIAGALASRTELSPGVFPFASCAANPFPITFSPDGAPVSKDLRCSESGSDRPPADSFGLKAKRFFRSIAAGLGIRPR